MLLKRAFRSRHESTPSLNSHTQFGTLAIHDALFERERHMKLENWGSTSDGPGQEQPIMSDLDVVAYRSRRSSDNRLMSHGDAFWPEDGAATHELGFLPSSRPFSKSTFITSGSKSKELGPS